MKPEQDPLKNSLKARRIKALEEESWREIFEDTEPKKILGVASRLAKKIPDTDPDLQTAAAMELIDSYGYVEETPQATEIIETLPNTRLIRTEAWARLANNAHSLPALNTAREIAKKDPAALIKIWEITGDEKSGEKATNRAMFAGLVRQFLMGQSNKREKTFVPLVEAGYPRALRFIEAMKAQGTLDSSDIETAYKIGKQKEEARNSGAAPEELVARDVTEIYQDIERINETPDPGQPEQIIDIIKELKILAIQKFDEELKLSPKTR